MARPNKQVVDYFSHDTDASQGKTLTIILSKYGPTGYAFWFMLLELLGRTPGHAYDFTDAIDWEFLLAKTHVSDHNNATEMLNMLAIMGAIDEPLYRKGIIWCQNFVDRLDDVYNRRSEKKPEKPVIADKNPVNVDNNVAPTELLLTETPQSKLKETKLKDSKEKERKKEPYGEFHNVLLTGDEHQKLIAQFGEPKVVAVIERLSSYMESKGKRYKSHYATILNWQRRNGDVQKANPRGLPKVRTGTPDYPEFKG